MEETKTNEPWVELGRLAEAGSSDQIESYIEQLPASDVALAVSRLSEEDQTHVLTLLTPADAADLVEQLTDVQAAELIEHLDPQAAAAIVDELPSNAQADLLGDLSPEDAEAVLEAMVPEEAEDARRLSQYADDVAGGLMVTEYLSFPEDSSVGDVVDNLRANADQYADYDVQYALCVNTMVAVSIGGVLPLVMKRLKIDPAIASGPLLTTVTDMCGFFLVLGTATMWLKHLTG